MGILKNGGKSAVAPAPNPTVPTETPMARTLSPTPTQVPRKRKPSVPETRPCTWEEGYQPRVGDRVVAIKNYSDNWVKMGFKPQLFVIGNQGTITEVNDKTVKIRWDHSKRESVTRI